MDDFLALRETALALLVDEGVADPARLSAAASGLLKGMRHPHLWDDLPLDGRQGQVTGCYGRLRVIAMAWVTPGTVQFGDDEVLERVVDGLDLLHRRHFNEGSAETGNWWFWEIGSPGELARLCVLLGDRLGGQRLAGYLRAIDRFCPDADRRTGYRAIVESGANRADKAYIIALRGVAGRDGPKLAQARDGLSAVLDDGQGSVFGYVDSGDGFYRDGSFIQHGEVAYTGSYGVSLLTAVAQTMALLGGSAWAVTDPGQRVILDAVERSFSPFVLDGLMMDAVRGRAASRQGHSGRDAGRAVAGAVLLLAESAPEPYRTRFEELAKGWIERGGGHPVPTRRELAFRRRAGVAAAPPLTGHFVFPSMDRVVHRRPGWSFAISMSSRRIAAYEAINDENLHGWHTGDGMTYLYTGGFEDGFWPTADPRRLPGTTVDTRPRDDLSMSAHRPANTWAGGAVLGGRYGAASMELIGDGVSLRARKSWFCLDDAVVALGSGITSHDGRTIETVVDNRVTGAEPRLEERWAHLEGVGGYVFPEVGPVRGLRESRTGTWHDINTGLDTGGTAEPVTRDYVTIWFDHGVSPVDAAYAYVLLPNATLRRTRAFSRSSPLRVLSNTPAAQAVQWDGLIAATFWQAGAVCGEDEVRGGTRAGAGDPPEGREEGERGGGGMRVAVDAPCAVLVRRARRRISVAVADPSHSVDTVTLTLDHPVSRVGRTDDTVEVRIRKYPAITVRLGGSRGRTHTCELVPT
ncbi:polysaccharide lyase 8 family protein [Nonomuraea sp. LPB2021202275-12-8]|uniref:polysaccharide lyase 8 family protein n=1 Tax=Nonomuraea sp. LPB2021202275-12-8 TaxID=3120159 RepID=UPI00300C908B